MDRIVRLLLHVRSILYLVHTAMKSRNPILVIIILLMDRNKLIFQLENATHKDALRPKALMSY